MLISTTEELRLYSPAHAIDHIDSIQGYITSSEKDTLLEKLGTPLYEALVKYYRDLRASEDGISTFIKSVTEGEDMPPYAQLLTVCQRIITFDALGRAIDIQAVSVNGSGVNISTADDYGKADDKAIQAYKSTCIKETHAAINALLVMLEQWYKEATPTNPENPLVPAPSSPVLGDSVAENEATVPDDSPSGETASPSDLVIHGRNRVYVLGNLPVTVTDNSSVHVNSDRAVVTVCGSARANIERGTLIARDRAVVNGKGLITCYDSTTIYVSGGVLHDKGHLDIIAYNDAVINSFTNRRIKLNDQAILNIE